MFRRNVIYSIFYAMKDPSRVDLYNLLFLGLFILLVLKCLVGCLKTAVRNADTRMLDERGPADAEHKLIGVD